MASLSSNAPEPAISLSSVSVWHGQNAAHSHNVLDNLSFRIEPGERVALIGPNGAGKTSLLMALIGAVPFEGTIRICQKVLRNDTLREIRREIGFVFAEPLDQLFLPTVKDEVAFGPEQRGLSQQEVRERVAHALSLVGLEGFESRLPSTLSLGEQRRLAIATVLSCRPKIVLLDEPTASLDPRARRRMLETIANFAATIVCATHDLDAALDLDARAILLNARSIVADGPARVVLNDRALIDAAGLELPLSVAGRARPSNASDSS